MATNAQQLPNISNSSSDSYLDTKNLQEMLIKLSVLHLIFVSNLIGKSYSAIHKVSRIQSSSKSHLNIVASDDEVLHPLFEKKERDSSNIKSAISCQNSSRSSRNSKKGKKKSIPFDEGSSFLKMNLDLPSIISNSASITQKAAVLNQKNPFSFSSSTKYGSSTSNVKSEATKERTQDLETLFNFNSPFGTEIAEDIDIVLFRKDVSKIIAPGALIALSSSTVTPGTVISSSSSSVTPGTVISSSSSSVTPGTVIIDSSNVIATKTVTHPLVGNHNIPIGVDSPNFELENKIPCNVDFNDNKPPFPVLPPRVKKVRSLDEYSIEGLTFDSTIPGPKISLDTDITIDFISETLIPFFKSGKVLDRKSSYSVKVRKFKII